MTASTTSNRSKSHITYALARQLIPGGTQLLSKRPETFLPDQWPAYYRQASGCEVEDLDGNHYIDVSLNAVGACVLGYADPDVDAAVVGAVKRGTMSTLNCPEEVALAERMCELHPWARMVRYARTGGEAMAIAVRIARAATGRTKIAFCGYHGWHDWYLSANLADGQALDGHLLPQLDPAGVPPELAGTALPFPPGDEKALRALLAENDGDIAAVVMEPARYHIPAPGYLENIKSIAAAAGAVLVFDEITTGFRMAVGGLHRRLGVDPDIAVFAKGISNGYPMAAVIGRRAVMEASQRTFISSTYWTEAIGPVAALATIAKLAGESVCEYIAEIGEVMRAGWVERADHHGVPLSTKGLAPLPSFAIDHPDSQALLTLYSQHMLDSGFLASPAFYAGFAHKTEHVAAALNASELAFAELRSAMDAGDVMARLRGPVRETGLRKSTR